MRILKKSRANQDTKIANPQTVVVEANSIVPEGLRLTRVCPKCTEERPLHSFQHHKGRPGGHCRVCKTQAMKVLRATRGITVKRLSRIEGDRKLCMGCDQMKLLA